MFGRKKRRQEDLSPETLEKRRAKAEAEAEKAFKQDVQRSKYFMIFALVLIIAILFASIFFGITGEPLKNMLNTAIPVENAVLDPHKARNYWEAGLCSLVFETLVKTENRLLTAEELTYENSIKDENKFFEKILRSKVEPLLAESWQCDKTGVNWIFTLRQGVSFHDESEFTASDVVASFSRLLGFDAKYADDKNFPYRRVFVKRDASGKIIAGIKKRASK